MCDDTLAPKSCFILVIYVYQEPDKRIKYRDKIGHYSWFIWDFLEQHYAIQWVIF